MKQIQMKMVITGQVQGMGFRPYLYRLARDRGLVGTIANGPAGVVAHLEGTREALEDLAGEVELRPPRGSDIESIDLVWREPSPLTGLEIVAGSEDGPVETAVLPDLAICSQCVDEIYDPADRRYLYPFTNCIHCGPRYSIITGLPYDRPRTTMANFPMCDQCEAEYRDPANRRFHSQPISCPHCGPQLFFRDEQGEMTDREALARGGDLVRQGKILALQGVGGFQLIVDSRSEEAVRRLRGRKHRPDKPLAVAFSRLSDLTGEALVSPDECRILTSPAGPIVLVKWRPRQVHSLVAPGSPYLGAMLATTPLHHLLLTYLSFPVVATSGNVSGEPLCISPDEAFSRLAGLADGFLYHNRPIVRPLDDSVVQVVDGRLVVIRRGRGYVPGPLVIADNPLWREGGKTVVAVGGDLKGAVAVADERRIVVSQYLGDLGEVRTNHFHREVLDDLVSLYGWRPEEVACDLHPDYHSTRLAGEMDLPCRPVQHHLAHSLAGMVEHRLAGPVLAVVWDGTGWGGDGTVWGGEFLLVSRNEWRRVGHFRHFPLVGGEGAIRRPRQTGLGLAYEVVGEEVFERGWWSRWFDETEGKLLQSMVRGKVRCPLTSSVGRLFDGVAALVGMGDPVSYEGQRACEFEWAVDGPGEAYRFALDGDGDMWLVDWRSMVREILDGDEELSVVASRFHQTLVEMAAAVVEKVGCGEVLLTGGCFQNQVLLAGLSRQLEGDGRKVYWPERFPVGDGGLALGQVVGSVISGH